MNRTAWILGNMMIQWSCVVVVLAILAGACFYLSAVLRSRHRPTAAALALPLAILLSMILGKQIHLYFLPDAVHGYALLGCFAGCGLSVLLLKIIRAEKNPARLLDCMAIGGCAAIAVGRLSCFFTADDRGRILSGTPGFPLAWPVINATSGETEYRLAVFLFQSFAAALVFLILLAVEHWNKKKAKHHDGDITLLFLLFYTASQIVFDSMRYDALHLRSNGFIGAVALVCAIAFVCTAGILLARLIKRDGFRLWHGLAAFGIAGCIGLAAYMEYFVQRHGGQAALGYTVMSGAMVMAVAIGIALWISCGGDGGSEQSEKKRENGIVVAVRGLISMAATVCLLLVLLLSGDQGVNQPGISGEWISDPFFMNMSNVIQDVTVEIRNTEKRYWISADANRAPKPNKENYGRTTSPEEIEQVLVKAQKLLNGQALYFDPNVQTLPGTDIRYYLDDTILCITWKQEINDTAYSFSEVKIADPSQFRRYFSEGVYGSGKLVYPTEMANSVNSVSAISGDYYMFRNAGVIVYKGKVYRANTGVDTCFVDKKGNLRFKTAYEAVDMEAAQQFVDENDILFSVAFGPILVEDGQERSFGGYAIGEVGGSYSRAAICQMDELHYLLVNAAAGDGCTSLPTMYAFQDVIVSTGCQSAYALDGGQTAAMMMNGELINNVFGGYQRKISDILYFATAIPHS